MKKSILVAFLLGLVMAVALGVAGMTQPSKVIGFLDVFGDFDPTLAFVMAGAVGVHAIGYRLVMRRARPVLGESFQVPRRSVIDARLVAGAAIFGVGWGLSGFCPGPALVSLGGGSASALLFVVAMIVGQRVFDAVDALAVRGQRAPDAGGTPPLQVDG
ncbi:YeeE/YedE family protein [Myxococcota bacterium]|nr:YeeE/YedE family protein [Myxococcota bacterium]